MIVEHDARCDNHEAGLRQVQTRQEELARELHQDELRVERLISDVENLMERIPHDLGAEIARLSGQVSNAIRGVDELKGILRSDFVTRAELDPIRRLVYGVTALMLTAVVSGVLALVILR